MNKNIFESLLLRQKIQLYMLVPILYFLVFFIFKDIFYVEKIEFSSQNIQKTTNKTDNIQSINTKKTVAFIEQQIDHYLITTNSVAIKDKLFILELNGTLDNLTAFLQKIQLHFQIVSFQFSPDQKKQKLNLVIDTHYFFNRKFIDKVFTIKQTDPSQSAIKIEAIIDNEVFIAGDWFKKGDIYHNNKILFVNNKRVQFINLKTNKKLIVEVNNEPL